MSQYGGMWRTQQEPVPHVDEGVFSQGRAGVRFEWGMEGAPAVLSQHAALVVVDILSFSTATTIAVAKGTAVYPHAWPSSEVEQFARRHGAAFAVRRRQVDGDHPWSLSPTHLMVAPHVDRLVLPSPNGSAIAAAAAAEVVLVGSLRNASAVGRWLRQNSFGTVERPVVVIAAGERWASGALRPALEDLLGAGAVIASFDPDHALSPEAEAARAAWMAAASCLPDTLKACSSGAELTAAGYESDVLLAAEGDVESVVPLLVDGAFRPAEA